MGDCCRFLSQFFRRLESCMEWKHKLFYDPKALNKKKEATCGGGAEGGHQSGGLRSNFEDLAALNKDLLLTVPSSSFFDANDNPAAGTK